MKIKSKKQEKKIFLILLFLYFSINCIGKILFNKNNLSFYLKYINDCYKLRKYKRKKIKSSEPFISICLPAYNMERFIESTLLSIINQSFQDFEIIIINDYSNDNTENIINQLMQKDKRIKCINHSKNLGVYTSRVDGVANSQGKYAMLMDSDDMLLNPHLLENLFNLYLKYNLDIIEYDMYIYDEKKQILYIDEKRRHFHNFTKKIIFQPELANLLFFFPNTRNYSSVICTSIRNKIIRKDILLKAFNYIGRDYYNKIFITAEDTLINLVIFVFANN